MILDLPEVPADPRFGSVAERVRHNRDLVALLQTKLREHPAEHWLAALEAAGIPAGPVLHFDEVFH